MCGQPRARRRTLRAAHCHPSGIPILETLTCTLQKRIVQELTECSERLHCHTHCKHAAMYITVRVLSKEDPGNRTTSTSQVRCHRDHRPSRRRRRKYSPAMTAAAITAAVAPTATCTAWPSSLPRLHTLSADTHPGPAPWLSGNWCTGASGRRGGGSAGCVAGHERHGSGWPSTCINSVQRRLAASTGPNAARLHKRRRVHVQDARAIAGAA